MTENGWMEISKNDKKTSASTIVCYFKHQYLIFPEFHKGYIPLKYCTKKSHVYHALLFWYQLSLTGDICTVKGACCKRMWIWLLTLLGLLFLAGYWETSTWGSPMWNHQYQTCWVFTVQDYGGSYLIGSSKISVWTPHWWECLDKLSFARVNLGSHLGSDVFRGQVRLKIKLNI